MREAEFWRSVNAGSRGLLLFKAFISSIGELPEHEGAEVAAEHAIEEAALNVQEPKQLTECEDQMAFRNQE